MTPTELVEYYKNLLITQYRTLPKARETVGINVQQIVANLIYTQVRDAFDLSTAVGAQLDILGAYVGARRSVVGFAPTIPYFALPLYTDLPTGFGGFGFYSDVTAPADFWKLYTTIDTAFILSDGQMSQLIAYLIAVHASDFSNKSIDAILLAFFGTFVTLTDNGDMTITYTHNSTDPSILFSLLDFLGLLPHPAGVGVIVVTI